MWFLVQVVKGNKHFEVDSKVGNQVMISDTTDMVVTARAAGPDGYRFEARNGNETFVVRDFKGEQSAEAMTEKFRALAVQMGALVMAA